VRPAQTFFINQEVGDFYRIDSILCLADAKHIREHLNVRAQRQGSDTESAAAPPRRAPASCADGART